MSKVKTKQIVISMVAILFALIMLSPFYIGIIYDKTGNYTHGAKPSNTF